MAKFDKSTIERWSTIADAWLEANTTGLTRSSIIMGCDAWTVFHRCGITREAYFSDRSVLDAHIQTAMETVFPNVVFKDRKVY